jgi:hypothetical protein
MSHVKLKCRKLDTDDVSRKELFELEGPVPRIDDMLRFMGEEYQVGEAVHVYANDGTLEHVVIILV